MHLLKSLLLLYVILEWTSAVEIGISRPYTPTKPHTTSYGPIITTDLHITTESTSEEASHPEFLTTADSTTLKDIPPTNKISTTTKPTTIFKPESTTGATKPTKSSMKTPKSTAISETSTTASTTIVKPKTVDLVSTSSTTTTTESPILYNSKELGNASHNLPSTKHSSGSKYYCACNLLTEVCDVNCCCDPDCEAIAFKVFDCFASPGVRLEDFQYQHGLPSCKINEGWLCVFRSNVREEKPKVPNILTDTSSLYKWPSLMLEAVQSQEELENMHFYKSGQPLQLINLETMEIKDFDLPYALINNRCQIKNSIKHLQSFRTDCFVSSLEELQQYKRDLLDTISSYSILKKPLKVELLNLEKAKEKNLLEIRLKRCILSDHLEDRKSDADDCVESKSTELEVENYCALEIEIILKHNFTTLLDCEIKTKERQIKYREGLQEYWQIFVVTFIAYNEAEKVPQQQQPISGPLGYLQGEPVIMAQYVPYNKSLEMSDANRVLDYFQPKEKPLRKDHTLHLMFKRRNDCMKAALGEEDSISYGINELRQCHVRLKNIGDLSLNPTDRNFTAVCVELQQLAMGQLLATDEMKEIWISQLGKPENNTAQKWTQLQWLNVEFAPIVGVYNEATKSFTCRNMLLNVVYQFQVGTFVEQGVAHQNLIKQATLTYERRHDLEFTLNETLELPLSVSVMFYDFARELEEQQRNSGMRTKLNLNPILQYLSAFIIASVYEYLCILII